MVIMKKLILLGLILAVNLLVSAQLSEVSNRIESEEPELFENIENMVYSKWVQRPTVVFDLNRQLGAYDRMCMIDTAILIPLILGSSSERYYLRNEYALRIQRHKPEGKGIFILVKVDWLKVELAYKRLCSRR